MIHKPHLCLPGHKAAVAIWVWTMKNPFSTLPSFLRTLRSSKSSFGIHENALKSSIYCGKEFLEMLKTSFLFSPLLLLMICTHKAMLYVKNFSLRLSKAPHLHLCFEMLLTVLPLLHRKYSFFSSPGENVKGLYDKQVWVGAWGSPPHSQDPAQIHSQLPCKIKNTLLKYFCRLHLFSTPTNLLLPWYCCLLMCFSFR